MPKTEAFKDPKGKLCPQLIFGAEVTILDSPRKKSDML
jgi:hypothetical protein